METSLESFFFFSFFTSFQRSRSVIFFLRSNPRARFSQRSFSTIYSRAAFCARTMTIDIITFAASRNLYRSLREILLCFIIRREDKERERERDRKPVSRVSARIKIVGGEFYPGEVSATKLLFAARGCALFCAGLYPFLRERRFSLGVRVTNYRWKSKFPFLMDRRLLLTGSYFDRERTCKVLVTCSCFVRRDVCFKENQKLLTGSFPALHYPR